MNYDNDLDDAMTVDGEAKSSRAVLAAIKKAEDAFREWQEECDTIDDIYSLRVGSYDPASGDWEDAELDLFWASFEILKPAVYARPPQPVVSPLFKDKKPVVSTTAELVERCAVSTFKRTGIDAVMKQLRDDVIFASRGAPWLRHEIEDGKHKVCVEHKDRRDFLHEPARKWSEVGWVAAAERLTRRDMRKRFKKPSGDAYKLAKYIADKDDVNSVDARAVAKKCKVWEVWHKADNKVYWVTEGVDVLLDVGEPHLDIDGFFPCPEPAFGTLQRRSLRPVPDWNRYAVHFSKISELTRRIYSLLDRVRMKGLIPAGGDVGDAISELIANDKDDTLLIGVPQAAMIEGGTIAQWLPLADIANAITGLIEARSQLIQDFYQLSGISDIMRGATEAEETLGAQQLKSQFGSVRVREKSMELQRVGADCVNIAAQIIAQKFPQDQILEMSQMEIPTKAEVSKRIKTLEKEAEEELRALAEKAEQARQQGEDPQQAFQQAQQQILQKYAPLLQQAQQQVPIEDVMRLLRDERARGFVFEIESSSTILTDELQEKSSRNELLAQFSASSQNLAGLMSMGEAGAKLAGTLLRFVMAPYRAGREVDAAIEEFIEQAPQMAAAMAGEGDEAKAIAEANMKLSEAELIKAQAATQKVQTEGQAKVLEIQQKQAEQETKAQQDAERFALEIEEARGKLAETEARIKLLHAQVEKMQREAVNQSRQQDREDVKTVADIAGRERDRDMAAQNAERDAAFRAQDADRADRQQGFAERRAGEGE